jgi:CubicO group peptidase (beta-lactamase class C family)
MLKKCLFLFVLLCSISLVQSQTAVPTKPQQLKPGTPESVGMSTERLIRLEKWLAAESEKRHIPGSMLIVARKGKIVYHGAVGYNDIDTKEKLKKDQIFRIMSMSKAITTVAVLMLYEEGYFQLDDPVSNFIPEFKNAQVLTEYHPEDTTFTAVPAQNQVTIRQLLAHTAGIKYSHPLYYKAGIPDFFSTQAITIGETMPKLAALPLMHEPGTKYTYGLGTDMLGYLVERVSGMRFGDYLQKKIFDPLGMGDTGFYVKKGQEARLMHQYMETDDSTGVRRHSIPDEELFPISGARAYESGGAGLTSTVLDYAKFLQMLLNGGSYNNHQLIGRKTVEMMCRNQQGDVVFNGGTNQFGLGLEIITEKGAAKSGGTPGSFRWGGRNGSDYVFDPKEQLLMVWTTQVVPTRHWYFTEMVRRMVYTALVD